MSARDPITGQFVSNGDAASLMAAADDIVTDRGGAGIGVASADEDFNGVATLTFGQDVEVLALRFDHALFGTSGVDDVLGLTSDGHRLFREQVSVRDTFHTPPDDTGVLWAADRVLPLRVLMEDDASGNAASSGDGVALHSVMLQPGNIPDVTPEFAAGQSIYSHLRSVQDFGGGDGTSRHRLTAFVATEE